MIQLCFVRSAATGFFGENLRLLVFVATACCLLFLLYLRRVPKHLDPSAVIPERVRHARHDGRGCPHPR